MIIKNYILSLLVYTFVSQASAQQDPIRYHDVEVLGKLVETDAGFHRVDTVKYHALPLRVKGLYTHSAGLFVHFRTNAKEVFGKWCTTEKKVGLNMTAIATKGLDVYIKNKQGRWQYAGSQGANQPCRDVKLVQHLDTSVKDFLVYLPLYDEVKSIQIGVPTSSSFELLPNPFGKKIAVYGSSIVHGASAGRSGMAYPAIMSRNTGLNFVNLGVSGNARIEIEVAQMLADSDADAFILDCVPNSSPEQIAERTIPFVQHLRKVHPNKPIIMIPSVVRELSHFNQHWGARNVAQNLAWKKQYELLINKGTKHLYYLDSDNLLGDDHEGTTDGTHPNDLGFMRMVEQIQPFVIKVLQSY